MYPKSGYDEPYSLCQPRSDYLCDDTPPNAGVVSFHLNIHEKYNFPSELFSDSWGKLKKLKQRQSLV